MIRAVFYFILKKIGVFSFYSLTKSGYLYDVGWFKSFNEKIPVNQEGKPIPWMNYTFLEFIKPRLSEKFIVFEYGSGNSTLWWSNLVSFVYSCEHDINWFNKINKTKRENSMIFFAEQDSLRYRDLILEVDLSFDIIVIDGVNRNEVVPNVMRKLNKNGVIIFDNSDREMYENAYKSLFDNGFKELKFYGLGPCNVMGWATSIFYKTDNCLGI